MSALNPYQAHRLLHAHLEPQGLYFSPSKSFEALLTARKPDLKKPGTWPGFVHSDTHRKSPGRSEHARDGFKDNAFPQAARVIVNVHHEHARSYRLSALLQSLAHELAGLARQLVQMPVPLFLGIEHRPLAVLLQQVGMNLPHLQ